ncbi:MAG: hypothetical protein Q8Q95_00885 [bacterium]|nr:hypothetical protein [bacterium]
MTKNFFVTLTAIAVMATVGYASYTNGSITDLSQVINSKVENLTSSGSNYLSALVTTKVKVVGTAERKTKNEGPSLSVSVGSTPKAQTILAASKNVLLANYVLDTGKSNKDLVVESMKLTLSFSKNANPDDLINCRLGGISVEGLLLGSTSKEFVVRNLVLTKGIKSSLPLNCDIVINPKSVPGSTFAWGIKGKADSVVVKDDSGTVFTAKVANAKNHNATIRNSGELKVILNPVASKARNISCGSSMPMSGLKLSAKYEDINVKSLSFKFSGSTSVDVVKKITIYDNLANILGEGVFSGGSTGYASTSANQANITLNQDFIVPTVGTKSLYITTELSNELVCKNAKGKTVAIDYNGVTSAVGVTSASTITLVGKVSAPRNTIR